VKLIRSLDQLPVAWRGGAVAIGNYDGVHLGHAQIAARLLAAARQVGGPAVMFTFDPSPAALLRPDHAPSPLTWLERKVELLLGLGIDGVIAYPTDQALLRHSAQFFFEHIILQHLAARAMVEGPNFFFGHNREGNVERLQHFCQRSGLSLEIVTPVEVDGQVVSSSRIRALVAAGNVELAARMLDRPYRIRGDVIRGAGRGRQLGFPTANLGRVDTLLPGEGIYAGVAHVDGQRWPAAMSLGPNPTFDEGRLKVEVHLDGYQGNLYDRQIEVDFLARLRDIVRYHSVADLVAQLQRDVQATRELAEAAPSPGTAQRVVGRGLG
jgi:riboflavin kinase/FMN adenylyltransferase